MSGGWHNYFLWAHTFFFKSRVVLFLEWLAQPVHKWTSSAQLHELILSSAQVAAQAAQGCAPQQWFESVRRNTSSCTTACILSSSTACILHGRRRSATWADSQVHIPQAVCYNQSQRAISSGILEEFQLLIWSILLGILDFQSQNLIKEEKMKIYSASSKIPSGQVVQSSHWPCCMCSLNLTAVRSNPAGQQSNRSNFFQMNLKSAILKSQPPPFPLWEVGAGMGERAGEILKIILSLTLSVLNCGVHCPRNPIQIWTLYQPGPRTYKV